MKARLLVGGRTAAFDLLYRRHANPLRAVRSARHFSRTDVPKRRCDSTASSTRCPSSFPNSASWPVSLYSGYSLPGILCPGWRWRQFSAPGCQRESVETRTPTHVDAETTRFASLESQKVDDEHAVHGPALLSRHPRRDDAEEPAADRRFRRRAGRFVDGAPGHHLQLRHRARR